LSTPEPTLVTHAATAPDQDEVLRRRAALAELAFASGPAASQDFGHGRHLAFLASDALDLDLTDPNQRRFGDYELLEKLGQGGMGVVYRARQRSLDREVALKLLSAGPWASKDFIERFRREAQSAARMQHPNIVAIHEIGTHEELNFFSMRLVQGPSLAALLARDGAFEPRRAAELVRVLAEALHYAHRLGVLHLDLKPANVLIDESGQAQVADFGLARRLDDTLALDCDEVSGTPSYMAPEQAQVRRHPLSPATDIYGLGAILYELLCNRPPFLAATPQETLRRVVLEEPAPPSATNAAVNRDLDAICLRCLAKDPAARYGNARELADDLGRFLEQRETRARPLNHFERFFRLALREPRLSALAALLTLSLALGFVGAIVRRSTSSSPTP
jgi:serine/threonine protein kinase